ncbi:tRNA (adenosine(37)-N6)-dimethylallyltransferase MiaA [Francisella philomiragia]|uniref:tRNA dimethylallyltransferase n=1 Tax=Francisella philomiragia subsp. philomiragia (strain ATCC 25017 / CCUG 19701 / FSC 153 / O\|nr:tRNA (adenosine(37)-N6)-dimethylallyltransferase MiaA [Francisella philomiragia]B0TZB0.1 RecName: Full=tRNA dimethylallyltransferase; AltName: Full=Dimethylallyl diphosphate:tRNA dimethylallyltransferase; Short=DMAPP:tRNA dimethylallyltransferase; Short=DMATase; AltName: Full=Isopentenyl-diphosphate:tRNA isopentenyltransferase; Short=IPP transferase; Short=IPPT; Short=IPTase [Francisella philomiragia subsp. philomiragia ATCC 25017]AJI47379.1 tRNA dimethylallyltransferase [Francisella philomira
MNKLIYGLAGPTASGKTSLSISIANKINAEIISVDSSLVYKGMNIGTAKPTLDEQGDIKHHLIDIIEPTESFSVADFITNVNKLKKEIWSRGKEVLLVGGTMLYFKGLIEGLSSLPESQLEIRQTLELERKAKGLQYLHQQLNKMDQESAQKINPNDQQRIFRALEVIMITGKKYSELVKTSKVGGLEEQLKLCALVPNDRSILHNNIELRFKQMLDQGFLDEVQSLRKNPKLTKETTAIRSVGYRQAWEYLDGDISYEEFVKKGIVATRQLAKRQLTWIRNWQDEINLVEVENQNKEQQILEYFDYK